MSDKGFTSGERRGLIVLLVIMCCIVGWSIIAKSCTGNVEYKAITEEAKQLHDSIISSKDTSRVEKTIKKSGETKKSQTKKMRPDGKKRNYLAEPIHE
ncbi:MAG: hypothetical protein K2H84_01510 [Paramuribaculum sp.]|nr:hypothetical protein [Paramuribaculum sp.]